MAPKLAIIIAALSLTCGATIGFVAGYFFAKGPNNEH